MKWSKAYYISQGATGEDHLKNIETVCQAGCELVQLRMKNVEEEEYIQIARAAMDTCLKYGAMLFINDKVNVAVAVEAHGVHLGKEDLSPYEARAILREGTLIGGTANSEEDCNYLLEQQVDYIGLGPFRFTTTKENLSPVLSLEEFRKICAVVKSKSTDVPVYAIGGIVKEDVEYIYEVGVHGVAISGALSNASTDEEKLELKNIVDHCENFSLTH